MVIKLIIAGGRDFNDYNLLEETCDFMLSKLAETHQIQIISGGAAGADTMGARYAGHRGFDLIVMKADWDKHGKSAGYKRNAEMAAVATHLIAFWDGQSRGTNHMINIANDKNLKSHIVKY